MKILCMLLMVLSCKAADQQLLKTLPKTTELSEEGVNQKVKFKNSPNASGTMVLYYRVIHAVNSPVTSVEFYVKEQKSGKILKPTETLAAEKIYWKDNNSIAVIPYEDAMKHQELGEILETREIIIKIK